MTNFSYSCPAPIARAARKAAEQWNIALRDLAVLRQAGDKDIPDISIKWGKIDQVKHPGRIAECRLLDNGYYFIILSDNERWAINWWERIVGRGFNVTATIMHEFGHVFKLPHATDPAFIMHPEIPDKNSLTSKERSLYREKFLRIIEDE